MTQSDDKLELARPNRALLRMAIGLVAVIIGLGFLFPILMEIWSANWALNSLILVVLIGGIFYCFMKVFELRKSVTWLISFADEKVSQAPPSLLVPMARLVRYDHQDRLMIFPHLAKTVLDSVDGRLAEARDISRYTRNLLVFLGLLGTFWGLILTVQGVLGAIENLNLTGDNLAGAFDALKSNLSIPMAGMATAFGTSLTGLGGSMILGFFDLQLGRAQNNYYNHMEEWLSGQVRMESQNLGVSGGGSSAYLEALVEQTAESLNQTRKLLIQMVEDRGDANRNLAQLAEEVHGLGLSIAEEGRGYQQSTTQIQELRYALERLQQVLVQDKQEDESMTDILRNIDRRLAKNTEQPRDMDGVTETLRDELRLMTKTLASTLNERT
ncbi:MAG: flagellar motor protein MotA [SAR116 cluster bacterium]|nr:flagellar motor protein MotA [Paracoccaceae bacterium]RCL80322.1 MAG: flagellar motor protein MotA [SAR116 cluster bacterium]HBQ22902.1 flagellar motor protein MotA [Alphaproteobacteria bacterium]HCJ61763.1 flagellar motor protein MotA [Alphaproteobacteria bacterium]|tara:strand:- start:432 stop:1583 length:1152 start_codon:yes stop_codon:yes gene_type:complete